MSEYISDNANTSNGQSSNLDSESNSSPSKNWVQFDDGAGSEGPQKSISADGTPVRHAGSNSQTTTSGVSSARGSVNSLPQQSHTNGKVLSSPEGAQLSVSEIQVILHFDKRLIEDVHCNSSFLLKKLKTEYTLAIL